MLPWEILPILRSQEVYRMPSVGCITAALAKGCQYEEQSTGATAIFPFIDPLDAFYLLNPSGDLSGTQNEFENWLKIKIWRGSLERHLQLKLCLQRSRATTSLCTLVTEAVHSIFPGMTFRN